MIISARKSDIALAVMVVAIVAMLLIPLPTALLDVLLAINISFSLLLLLVGLYTPNALALLAFPSILLLSALFRLGLNVASTRLILSQAYAGEVIAAFGDFLIRGEVVVGVIIFVVITIVNFIVVARGSSRVSEVAARFALDALPGKQMAIDSELRSGLLTAEEAQQRREELRKESQLYGAMDGAMKYVQGDVIAGFFLILANIVGGMYMGVSSGMSFSGAVQTYTRLTVGDGLVSQIPALLISICAGIIVTRVSSGENATLGSDVGAQLFARPGTLFFSGALLFLIGALPGLPPLPFVAVGTSIILAAFYIRRNSEVPSAAGLPTGIEGGSAGQEVRMLAHQDESKFEDSPLVISLDSGVLYKLYRMSSVRYEAWWRDVQEDFYNSVGLKLPPIHVVSDDFAAASHYSISVAGSIVERGEVLLDSVLVEMNPDSAEAFGLEILDQATHPISGARVFWALQSPSLRKIIDAANIRISDFFEYIALKAARFYQHYPEEALHLSDVHALLKQVETRYPGLIEASINTQFITAARLTDILQELVREGINIKDFRQILEVIASYCASFGSHLESDDVFDLQDVIDFVRQTRRRQFVSGLLSERGTLKVITLSEEVEAVFDDLKVERSAQTLALDPKLLEEMTTGLGQLLDPVANAGLLPVAILCRTDLRRKVQSFLFNSDRLTRVVSFDELEPRIAIEPVGEWRTG